MARTAFIDVCVLARADAPTDVCLRALRAAGADDVRVVAVGADGVAQAMNRALGDVHAPVVAFVDDDVAVSPGWWTALQAAWRSPGAAGLGATGGPIAVGGARPAWLTQELLPAFATVDHGDVARRLDPALETLHAGNLALRVEAALGVGALWPARGHPTDARDWFGPEHALARELGAAGWALGWEPAAAAVRHVDPDLRRRDVVRRRLRYGARLQLLGGGRPAATSARVAATSGAGTLAATAARDEGLAVTRAARAAENVGALLGGLVAHADAQPVATRTVARASVPPAAEHPARALARQGLARLPRRGGTYGMVLLYHRVCDLPAGSADGLAVAPRRFGEQLEALAGRVWPLEAVVRGEAPPGSVALTFDDGYADNLHEAAPRLAEHGAEATLFACTGPIAAQRPFWWDELPALLEAATPAAGTPLRVVVEGERRTWPGRDAGERAVARRHLAAWLQPQAPAAIESALDQVASWGGVPRGRPGERDRPVTVDELRALAADGPFALGAHTREHRCLAAADAADRRADLLAGIEDLTAWTGAGPRSVAFPFGSRADVDDGTVAAARELGFEHGLLTEPGLVGPGTDPLRTPRVVAPDLGGDAFRRWMEARLPVPRASRAGSGPLVRSI